MRQFIEVCGIAIFLAGSLFFYWRPHDHFIVTLAVCAAVGLVVAVGGTLLRTLSEPDSRWTFLDRRDTFESGDYPQERSPVRRTLPGAPDPLPLPGGLVRDSVGRLSDQSDERASKN